MEVVDLVDDVLLRLKAARTAQSAPARVKFSEEELCTLLDQCCPLLLAEPTLLDISAPITVAGDLRGQFGDVLSMFELLGYPPSTRYLVLGNYVGPEQRGIECMVLMLALKLRFPEHVFLLRGSYETKGMSRLYGLYEECNKYYSVTLWKTFVRVFDCLPLAALVGNRILCLHGGLSPQLNHLDQIRQIVRPTDVPDRGLLAELLWSAPDSDVSTFGFQEHVDCVCFGEQALNEACTRLDVDLICRAHQPVDKGYEFFGADRRLVTIFSAPSLCIYRSDKGPGYSNNKAAVMHVSPAGGSATPGPPLLMTCSFTTTCKAATTDERETWQGTRRGLVQ